MPPGATPNDQSPFWAFPVISNRSTLSDYATSCGLGLGYRSFLKLRPRAHSHDDLESVCSSVSSARSSISEESFASDAMSVTDESSATEISVEITDEPLLSAETQVSDAVPDKVEEEHGLSVSETPLEDRTTWPAHKDDVAKGRRVWKRSEIPEPLREFYITDDDDPARVVIRAEPWSGPPYKMVADKLRQLSTRQALYYAQSIRIETAEPIEPLLKEEEDSVEVLEDEFGDNKDPVAEDWERLKYSKKEVEVLDCKTAQDRRIAEEHTPSTTKASSPHNPPQPSFDKKPLTPLSLLNVLTRSVHDRIDVVVKGLFFVGLGISSCILVPLYAANRDLQLFGRSLYLVSSPRCKPAHIPLKSRPPYLLICVFGSRRRTPAPANGA